jgi:hypothetical protein
VKDVPKDMLGLIESADLPLGNEIRSPLR